MRAIVPGVLAVLAPALALVRDDESSSVVAEIAVTPAALAGAGLIWPISIAPVVHR